MTSYLLSKNLKKRCHNAVNTIINGITTNQFVSELWIPSLLESICKKNSAKPGINPIKNKYEAFIIIIYYMEYINLTYGSV